MTSPDQSRSVAIGYLRLDVSGDSEFIHRDAIEELAAKWGYDLVRTEEADEFSVFPVAVLINAARLDRAVAVFVPSARHFEGCTVPDDLLAVCSVVTVADKQTYARRPPSPSEIRSVTQQEKEMN
ncbi:hypothetical protein [Nocardia sp. NPDC051833]|uniref:hypothetical protein n=1 Tax=Nocardia sp. NPDC051833 TaxID=3155674 RepID=UPI003418458F